MKKRNSSKPKFHNFSLQLSVFFMLIRSILKMLSEHTYTMKLTCYTGSKDFLASLLQDSVQSRRVKFKQAANVYNKL